MSFEDKKKSTTTKRHHLRTKKKENVFAFSMVVVLLFSSGYWRLMFLLPRLEVTHIFSGRGIWAEAGLGGFCRHGWAECKAHLATDWLPCAFIVWFEMLSRGVEKGVISSLFVWRQHHLFFRKPPPCVTLASVGNAGGCARAQPTTHRFGSEFEQPGSREYILPLCGPSSILCRRQIHLVCILLSPSVTLKFLFLWKSCPEHGMRKWLLIDMYLNCWTDTSPITKVILTNAPTAGRSSSAWRSRTAQPAGTWLQN